jgi:hypothetical protein
LLRRRLGKDPEDEDVKERLREHTELLEELRALIPGAQVLFGFLLAIRFTSPFSDLNAAQRYVYYATLLSTAVALVLLLAPSAYHRLRFREGDKDVMVRKGNREAIAGTGAKDDPGPLSRGLGPGVLGRGGSSPSARTPLLTSGFALLLSPARAMRPAVNPGVDRRRSTSGDAAAATAWQLAAALHTALPTGQASVVRPRRRAM